MEEQDFTSGSAIGGFNRDELADWLEKDKMIPREYAQFFRGQYSPSLFTMPS